MATRTHITLIDDLDGKDADETVPFSLDGVGYEIDLSNKNAQQLRAAFTRWTEKARRSGGRTARTRKSQSTTAQVRGSERLSAVRSWARENGYTVSDRGRIATVIQDAYDQGHG